MKVQNLNMAIENVQLQERVFELEAAAILTDLRTKIAGEEVRLKWEKRGNDLHILYRGLLI